MQELFEEYRSNRKLLARRLRELDSMAEMTDTVRGSAPEWPYTMHTMTVCGRNAEEETKVREEIRALNDKLKLVEDALRKTPNGNIRLMLELRYIDGLKWDEVAEEMDEDVGGDAIRKRAEAFFDTFDFCSANSVNS